jgi:LytS/YehU family sensor histidine kinase
MTTERGAALADHPDVPQTIVNYVDRLGRPLRLIASPNHDLFGRDPYVNDHAGAALLCVPLVNMRQRLGVLFLEKQGTGVFHHADLVTAEILAAQAAATLRNAREYHERLSVLQSQMHPHFLFNALSGIAELTQVDPPRAERAVLDLAALYRSILATSRQRAIPLAQELALVESYLTLEKLRFGTRLHYRFEVQGDITGALVPPLIVQPLVENAVNHGIARKVDGGNIALAVTAGEHRVHVRVSDDGVGWTAGGSGQGAGLGLSSIRRRLQLFFGAEAELSIDTANGVKVDLFFPMWRHEPVT